MFPKSTAPGNTWIHQWRAAHKKNLYADDTHNSNQAYHDHGAHPSHMHTIQHTSQRDRCDIHPLRKLSAPIRLLPTWKSAPCCFGPSPADLPPGFFWASGVGGLGGLVRRNPHFLGVWGQKLVLRKYGRKWWGGGVDLPIATLAVWPFPILS